MFNSIIYLFLIPDTNYLLKYSVETGSDMNSSELGEEDFEDLLEATEKGDLKTGDPSSTNKKIELTEAQKKTLEKAIEKQKKFMDGDVPKKRVTKKAARELKTIEASGMSYEDVGKDVGWHKKGTKCLVVRKLTKELIESSGGYDTGLSILSPYRYSRYSSYNNDESPGFVEEGIRLGTI